MEISQIHSYHGNILIFYNLLKTISRIWMVMTLEFFVWQHHHVAKRLQLLLEMNNCEFGIALNHLKRQNLLKLHKFPLLLPLTFAKHSNILTFTSTRKPWTISIVQENSSFRSVDSLSFFNIPQISSNHAIKNLAKKIDSLIDFCFDMENYLQMFFSQNLVNTHLDCPLIGKLGFFWRSNKFIANQLSSQLVFLANNFFGKKGEQDFSKWFF